MLNVNADKICSEGTEGIECTDKTGIFANNGVALVDEYFCAKVYSLLSAGSYDNLIFVSACIKALLKSRSDLLS